MHTLPLATGATSGPGEMDAPTVRGLRTRRIALACTLAFGATLASLPQAGHAGSATATFGVSATVVASCQITANNLAFGSYDPATSTPRDTSSTLSVTCSNGTPYNVRLDAGTASGATVTTRQMSNGANRLQYSLYLDASRSANWGQTDGVDTISGTGNGSAATHTVYGRMPANQFVPPASYADTVTVTVFF